MPEMTYADIRKAVLERFKNKPDMGMSDLRSHIGGGEQNLVNLNQVVWDLVVERALTFGKPNDHQTDSWPWIKLTKYGETILESGAPHLYDPEDYLHYVMNLVPEIDSIVTRYTQEAIRCYRTNLPFAAAVMLGAASERAILVLLETIKDWEVDPSRKSEAARLLEKQRSLPKIFDFVRATVKRVANGQKKPMPYTVHQGHTEHLFSLFEMIRVQRNDAVHPKAADVDRTRVFLALQSFPEALRVVERIRQWFFKTDRK